MHIYTYPQHTHVHARARTLVHLCVHSACVYINLFASFPSFYMYTNILNKKNHSVCNAVGIPWTASVAGEKLPKKEIKHINC